ncbi:S-crystallin 4 [Trichoplax sp. H2]|uniref:Uncharacterized protein n=1 Tax=Trichoplax adhaerens TaxID=10228 RepID=B3RW70_TRIAD|nr:expressed hypothetical protein [Trichoplax adhaerens]EDV25614.1 expressed hypothetical protein [Trichoplax adhaerens]RDD37713.1 S-crystallin 4 [Trichoplax sp. H2]|eukprot:XP_002111647.1 expressed hypothetical protein [Trichoplax adhaerens]
MPSYKLSYFNLRGRGEIIRYLFAVAGVAYEDNRITSEEWGKMKADGKTPFGQLPILEVDDKVLCQSNAIAAYLAREFDLAGKTNMDQYRISAIQAAVGDLMTKFVEIHFEKDETIKAKKQKTLSEEFLPVWLVAVEKIYQEGGTSFFAGDSITLGDLYFFFAGESLKGVNEQVFKSCPGLDGLYNRIANNSELKAWREKRPKTDF